MYSENCHHENSNEISQDQDSVESFFQILEHHHLSLVRAKTTTLQVNVGLLCNQACKHCHLNAGPNREEIMTRQTMDQVIALSRQYAFEAIDITGGAPEMNPDIGHLIKRLATLTPQLLFRTNLTALSQANTNQLIDLFADCKVTLVASLPATNTAQTNAQRGDQVFEKSIAMIKKLNQRGFGRQDTGLCLNLISNPSGAFLPGQQEQAEAKFRRDLMRKYEITFNNLYAFANVPLGRFKNWLKQSGNYETYLAKLVAGFNPCTIDGLMCRSLISVSWNGYLFDCDFNQAAGLYLGGNKKHISELESIPEPGSAIAVDDHCYACTAGSGFT